jgi:hypothetical protein
MKDVPETENSLVLGPTSLTILRGSRFARPFKNLWENSEPTWIASVTESTTDLAWSN